MKKVRVMFFCLSLAVFLMAGILSGCSRDSGSKQVKTLNFWFWDQNGDQVYDDIIAEFEKDHAGIKINKVLTPWADYWTKLQTALPTGTGPDIFWLNHPNAVSYLPTGLIMNLEPHANKIQYEHFHENFYAPYTYKGSRYGVPIFWDVTVLFYNKALFDKAGVPYPNENWTWTEFYDAARRLTVKEGNKTVQYGIIVDMDPQSGFCNFVLQNGGKIFNDDRMSLAIDSPEGREAIQFQLDAIHKNQYAPTIQELQETTKSTLFQSGIAAMVTSQTAIMRQFAEVMGKNLMVAPLPKQKQRASIFHNLAYVASAKTKYPEEVISFMTFLASKKHADILSRIWAPCYEDTAANLYRIYDWMDTRFITEAIEYSYPLPIAAKNAGAVYTLMGREMSKIYSNPDLGNRLTAYTNLINAEIAK
ncbi:MAG: sugar ABC transporter substrate-binding protein [Treponema sp.]|jgi:multiple sugar transport system substrate-binding protein|nr:sugar ABC transporter substrate-binding protein [Treponema sp.]